MLKGDTIFDYVSIFERQKVLDGLQTLAWYVIQFLLAKFGDFLINTMPIVRYLEEEKNLEYVCILKQDIHSFLLTLLHRQCIFSILDKT